MCRAADVRRAVAGADVVVHAAAITDVDYCEEHPDHALETNGGGTYNVEEAARATGCRVVYLSTDYVFDGSKAGAYKETDEPAPLNAYGRSKLEGERQVSRRPENTVVRTSWLIGEGRNFVTSVIELGKQRDTLQVVSDQRGRPTFAGPLAAALVDIAERNVSGIVNVTGDGDPVTWADLADASLERAGVPARIVRVSTEEYRASSARRVAPRPRNSVLDLSRARAESLPLVDWRRSLDVYLEGLR